MDQDDESVKRSGKPPRMLTVSSLMLWAGAVLALPGAPLRITVWAPVILVAIRWARRRHARPAAVAGVVYAHLLAAFCVVRSTYAIGGPATRLLLAGAILLGLPCVVHGFRTGQRKADLPDVGVLGACLVLGACGGAVALLPSIPFYSNPVELIVLATVFVCVYFIARTAVDRDREDRLMGIAQDGLVAVSVGAVLVLAVWLGYAIGTEQALATDRIPVATRRNHIANAWARRLDLPYAISAAARREADIARRIGDITGAGMALQKALRVNPADRRARRMLLNHAIGPGLDPRTALDCFEAMPDRGLDANTAARLVIIACRLQDWPALTRAWALCDVPARERAGVDENIAGTGLYYAGDFPAARIALDHWAEAGHPFDARATAIHNYLSRRRVTTEKGPQPGITRFGHALELTACNVSRTDVTAGDTLPLVCEWQTLAPLPPEWRVFVHVRSDQYGGYFFQGDHRFGDVGYANTDWPIDTPQRYQLDIAVPTHTPPGRYTLVLGVWDGRAHIPVTRHGDRQVIEGDRLLITRDIRITVR